MNLRNRLALHRVKIWHNLSRDSNVASDSVLLEQPQLPAPRHCFPGNKCVFWSLPPEMLRMVFEFAYAGEEILIRRPGERAGPRGMSWGLRRNKEPFMLSNLLVCREYYSQAKKTCLQNAVFTFLKINTKHDFFKAPINAHLWQHLSTLEVHMCEAVTLSAILSGSKLRIQKIILTGLVGDELFDSHLVEMQQYCLVVPSLSPNRQEQSFDRTVNALVAFLSLRDVQLQTMKCITCARAKARRHGRGRSGEGHKKCLFWKLALEIERLVLIRVLDAAKKVKRNEAQIHALERGIERREAAIGAKAVWRDGGSKGILERT